MPLKEFSALSYLPTIIALTAFPATAFSHHNPAVTFIPDETTEIEGVVRSVAWRNPHVTYRVDVTDESGETVTWSVESGAVMELRLRGLDRRVIEQGDRIQLEVAHVEDRMSNV